jgi:mannosyltransferase
MYNEALCLLYPSDYEGFGLPILEAQAAGCPVIAQNTSSIPEVIGENGLLIEHDTPKRMAEEATAIVKQLLSRPTQEIIEAGFENVKRFSWDKTYQQTKEVYSLLMQ